MTFKDDYFVSYDEKEFKEQEIKEMLNKFKELKIKIRMKEGIIYAETMFVVVKILYDLDSGIRLIHFQQASQRYETRIVKPRIVN